ncbi:MAG: Uncharacterised protein [Halieaceae bacterium]|nr:MAG: Uncharacterised protein [Halieaceae bacterium]
MREQFIFNFEGRQFVAARLDDIDRRATHNPVVTVLDHRNVAGAKPPVGKAGLCRLRITPVLQKDGRALDPNLAWRALPGDDIALLIHQLHRDIGQRLPHIARAPLTPIGIGERHADLCHAVAFQEHLPCEIPPFLKHFDGAGS